MYIENPEEDQINQNQSSSSPSVGAGGGGAAVGGGTSTGATGGNPSTIQPVQPNQPNQSFANVQDYLKANQQQGENFGNQFVSTVGQGVGKAKSDIDTSAQNAQNQITSGTITSNPDIISAASKTPTAITGDANKLAEFQKEYNAEYTGPSSFESSDQYTNAANAANTANQTGAELESTGGREQLLQDQFGVYGQGNKGLDQTLLQNSSSYPTVPGLAKDFKSVQDYLTAAAANTNTAANNAAATTAATKAAATTPFANNLTNFQNQINSETAAAKADLQAKADKYAKDFAAGDADTISKDLRELKTDPNAPYYPINDYLKALNKDYGVNPDISNYNNFNPAGQVTAANVATPEEYANAAAYQKLTGTDYSGILNPANASQAGTYKDLGKFDTQGLVNYLKGQVGQRDKEVLSGVNMAPTLKSLGSNVDAGTKLAQQYIDIFNRNGWKPSYVNPDKTGHTGRPVGLPPNDFDKLFSSMSQQFVKNLGGDDFGNGQMSAYDPSVAGQRAFLDTLSQAFYGTPAIR